MSASLTIPEQIEIIQSLGLGTNAKKMPVSQYNRLIDIIVEYALLELEKVSFDTKQEEYDYIYWYAYTYANSLRFTEYWAPLCKILDRKDIKVFTRVEYLAYSITEEVFEWKEEGYEKEDFFINEAGYVDGDFNEIEEEEDEPEEVVED